MKDLEDALRRRRLRPNRGTSFVGPLSPAVFAQSSKDITNVRPERREERDRRQEADRPIQPTAVEDNRETDYPSSPPINVPQIETSGEMMRKQKTEPKGREPNSSDHKKVK